MAPIKTKAKNLDMTQGEPARLLVLFAIPMLIGGIFQLMYNMTDTLVVGRFASVGALAAIGATGSTTSLIMMLGQGLTNAVSVVISQAEGAGRQDRMKSCVAHAVYLVLAGSLVLGLASFFGARPFLTLLGTPENIIDDAVSYVQITGGLSIALTAYNGVAAVLRAIGDSKTPLYFLILCSLLNVVLDLVFVIAFHGGVPGVAIATVISQAVSVVLCVFYMVRRYPRLRPDAASFRFDGKIIREYLTIGLPMCFQSGVLCVGMSVITAVINSFGSDIVAAYTIGGKVEQLATLSFSNLAFSFSVYAGQNYGARLYRRIGEGLKKGLLIIVGLTILSSAVMLLFARPLAQIFLEEDVAAVLDGAVAMIRTEACFFWALGIIWAVNSTLRGMGLVRIALVSSIVELVCKIGISVTLSQVIGSAGIWIAAPSGWVLGLIPSLIYLLRWFKHAPADGELPAGKAPAAP
ncbi:MAG TPA: MATE family efflux transporter [Candidatus Acutalibacter stercorigallinarum]|nr:MATE family efflux transporter [Candidatus Acutalibacter stercorigallinarum]